MNWNLPHLILLCMIGLTGCDYQTPLPPDRVPPDFSLALCFDPPPPISGSDVGGSVFIVEPDGTLRVATGPGCTLQTYPEPTKKLTPKEIRELYNLVRKIDFNQPAPNYNDKRLVWVRMIKTTHGQRQRTDIPAQLDGSILVYDDRTEIREATGALIYLIELSGLSSNYIRADAD